MHSVNYPRHMGPSCTCKMQLGQISTIIISSPSLAKQVFKTNDLALASRPHTPLADIVFYGSTDVALGPYSDYWRQIKKIITVEVLNAKKVKSFGSFREKEVEHFIEFLRLNSGKPVIMREKVKEMINNIMCKASFGGNCKQRDVLIEWSDEIGRLVSGFSVSDLFPEFGFLSVVSGMKSNLTKIHESLDRIFDEIFEERKIKRERNIEEDSEEDLLDVLLNIKENGGLRFSITENIIKAIYLSVTFYSSNLIVMSNNFCSDVDDLLTNNSTKNVRRLSSSTSDIHERCVSICHSHELNAPHDPHSIDLVLQDSENNRSQNNYTIELMSPQQKVFTVSQFFNGCTKMMVGSIRDCDPDSIFIVYATIHSIHKEQGWSYSVCKTYNKPVSIVNTKKTKSTFYCVDHGNVQAVSRFKVVLRLIDQSGSAPVVFFNNIFVKLFDHNALDLIEPHGMDPDDYWPNELDAIVGKKCIFKIFISEVNKYNNHTFRCDAFCDHIDMIKYFKKDFLQEDLHYQDSNDEFNTPTKITSRTIHLDGHVNRVLDMDTPSTASDDSLSIETSTSKRRRVVDYRFDIDSGVEDEQIVLIN